MNTNHLKRFAKEARIKLLDQVVRKLQFVLSQDTAELRGKEKEIAELKQKIKETSKEQVIEMVSYTWFNRLMALRFMDANGYTIPKAITPLPGMTNPEILQNALGGNLEKELSIDRNHLNNLLDGKSSSTDPHTEAYKMLLIASCNQWHTTMPFMFERINDYTELLLPDDLLSENSIVTDIRNGMSDEDCKQEELIGWLYQFYISDKKDDVFEKLKKNVKITPENIPAATQLFTPHWIVRYMVENTLGKLWLSLKPESKLRDFMPYYIKSPDGSAPVPIPEDLTTNTEQLPTKITFLDPCQGSGHVLVYAFDLFTKIYEEEGYNTNEIPELILKHNLFGIDIDERASQLAAFALTMKARNYYSRFLRKPVQPNVIDLENVSDDTIRRSVKIPVKIKGKKIENYSDLSLHLLTKADNFGSLIQIDPDEVELIKIDQGSIWQEQQEKLKEQAIYLSRQFHCVVTNPPYMGKNGMNESIKYFVEKNYKKSKSDLMACFMERCISLCSKNGKIGMINQHSWMFLSSYEDLRPYLIENIQFESMLHLGPRTFPEIGGEVVQSTSFVFGKYQVKCKGVFIRLTDFDNSNLKDEKTLEANNNTNCGWYFITNQNDFEKIPGSPIGYWVNDQIIKIFKDFKKIINFADSIQGMITGNNNLFLRQWFEIDKKRMLLPFDVNYESENKYWVPYNKGGGFRKWYGNHDYVVNWESKGDNFTRNRDTNSHLYFRPYISWSYLATEAISARFFPEGFLWDVHGSGAFPLNNKNMNIILGAICSRVGIKLLEVLNPTLSFQVENLLAMPIPNVEKNINVKINIIINQLIELSKIDWDFFETSWNYNIHPFLNKDFHQSQIKECYFHTKAKWNKIVATTKSLEEENNRIFIDAYGLLNKISESVSLTEITLNCNPYYRYSNKFTEQEYELQLLTDTIIDLISYSFGCILGRYSLDKPGLIIANLGETLKDFLNQISKPSFIPDEDNIIPVLEDEWFKDDIVGKFLSFLKLAFGDEHFEENLKFIEDTIGKDIRKYFVKDFYNDHIKRYKKRPIYWMFSSPKGSFRALIYMHRYQPDLCSKMLNDYLRAFISKLETKKQSETSLSIREDISAKEKTTALKEIDKLDAMLKDCREYEKTLYNIATQRISIDLDDGVKVNYQKFKGVLVPIKGLEKEEE